MKEESFRIENAIMNRNGHALLKKVNFQLFSQEIIGLIFNNSDEKNTLIKFLMCELPLHYGRIYIKDTLIHPFDLPEALKKSVYVITSPTSLCKQLSIQENLYYSVFPSLFISKRKFSKKALVLMEEFGFHFDPNSPIAQLTPCECCIIELLKAHALNNSIIVLADIIGALTPNEIHIVFDLVAKLKHLGHSFILIGYETVLFEYANTIALIQDGCTIGIFNPSEIKPEYLHKLFCKYSLPIEYKNATVLSEPMLSFDDIYSDTLQNISFSLNRGEVMKIIYSDDDSAKDLIRILKGNTSIISGTIRINKKIYKLPHNNNSFEHGIGFIEDNPLTTMLFKNLTVLENMCYPLSSKVSGFWMQNKYKKSVIKSTSHLINPKYLNLSISKVPQDILYISIYAKWLLFLPKVLICINPFSISDYQINQVINQMILLLTQKGVSIIIISSTWPSLCTIEGKLYYLTQGKLVDHETP